jgi:hypothetical protein
MMGGVSPETCIYEIKILIHCCILLDFICELNYYAQIHELQVSDRILSWACLKYYDYTWKFAISF